MFNPPPMLPPPAPGTGAGPRDLPAAVAEHALADLGVAALVDDRVFFGDAPRGAEEPYISFSDAAATLRHSPAAGVRHRTQVYRVSIFARDAAEAEAIGDAWYDAFPPRMDPPLAFASGVARPIVLHTGLDHIGEDGERGGLPLHHAQLDTTFYATYGR